MKNGDDNPSGAKKALSPTGEGFYNAKKEEPPKRDSSLHQRDYITAEPLR